MSTSCPAPRGSRPIPLWPTARQPHRDRRIERTPAQRPAQLMRVWWREVIPGRHRLRPGRPAAPGLASERGPPLRSSSETSRPGPPLGVSRSPSCGPARVPLVPTPRGPDPSGVRRRQPRSSRSGGRRVERRMRALAGGIDDEPVRYRGTGVGGRLRPAAPLDRSPPVRPPISARAGRAGTGPAYGGEFGVAVRRGESSARSSRNLGSLRTSLKRGENRRREIWRVWDRAAVNICSKNRSRSPSAR